MVVKPEYTKACQIYCGQYAIRKTRNHASGKFTWSRAEGSVVSSSYKFREVPPGKAGQQNEQNNKFHTRKMKETLNARRRRRAGVGWQTKRNVKIYCYYSRCFDTVEINAMWLALSIGTPRNALVPPYGQRSKLNLFGCFMMG